MPVSPVEDLNEALASWIWPALTLTSVCTLPFSLSNIQKNLKTNKKIAVQYMVINPNIKATMRIAISHNDQVKTLGAYY